MNVCENEFMLGNKNMASVSCVMNADILLISVNLSKKPMQETLSILRRKRDKKKAKAFWMFLLMHLVDAV